MSFSFLDEIKSKAFYGMIVRNLGLTFMLHAPCKNTDYVEFTPPSLPFLNQKLLCLINKNLHVRSLQSNTVPVKQNIFEKGLKILKKRFCIHISQLLESH